MALTSHTINYYNRFEQGGRSMKLIHKLMLGSKTKMVLSGFGVLALVLFTSLIVVEASKAEVTIIDNGEEQIVNTHKKTVGELFSEMGIAVGAYDELSHDQETPIEDGMTIDYKTAKQVTVDIDGNPETYYTTEETVQSFFEENDLSFSEHDEISHSTAEALFDGLEIIVKQAFNVAVNDGGKELEVYTTGGTVDELLQANGIELNGEDRIKPALDKAVTKDTEVNIVRVTSETKEIAEDIEFKTEKQEDDTLLKGKEQVITQGENGEVVRRYKITKENGEEVSRELIEEEIIKESKNRVVAVGTKEPMQQTASTNSGGKLVTLSSKSSESSGGKSMTVTASAFTADCNGCSGVTSTGIDLKSNPNQKVIAVDSSVIPLGTRVWVEGYGEAVAGDTGGAIRGNRIDVHVPTKDAANDWGVRTVTIKILD